MSDTPLRRLLIAAAALTPLLLIWLGCGLDGIQRELFLTACKTNCDVDQATCDTFCSCSYDYASENDRLDELEAYGEQSDQSPANWPPVMKDIFAECAGPMFDMGYNNDCQENCEAGDAACTTRCDCVLREIRGGGTVQEQNRWILENLVVEQTDEGRARIDAANAACPQNPT